MGDNQAAELMGFCASEFQQFFSHLGNSIHTYRSTGKVPGSAFKNSGSGHVSSAAAAKSDKPKVKRKPTAFNMFVKEKMEQMKVAGVTLDNDKNNNGMFSLAVAEWKKLSDAAKTAYTDKFKAALANAEGELEDGDVELADLPAPAVLAAASGDVDKVEKAKKKRKVKSDEGQEAGSSKDPAASPQAKPAAAAAAAPTAAPAAVPTATSEAPEGSERKKHKKNKDKSQKKEKSHKKERKETAV